MLKTTFDKTHIQIDAEDERRAIRVNGSAIPNFMAWNDKKYLWEFSGENIPDELSELAHEISNFIIRSEKK